MQKQIQEMELFKTALSTVSSVLSSSDSRSSSQINDSNVDIDADYEESSNLILSQPKTTNVQQSQQSNANTFRSQLNVVAGVIKEGETNQMTKLIYRVSRGKVATFFENIGTVDSDEESTA